MTTLRRFGRVGQKSRKALLAGVDDTPPTLQLGSPLPAPGEMGIRPLSSPGPTLEEN